jgi:hypothetical protein
LSTMKTTIAVGENNGLILLESIDHLFAADEEHEVEERLEQCQKKTRTLAGVRALHSWVTSRHGLSRFPIYAMRTLHERVMFQWKEMFASELSRIIYIPKLARDYRIWRAMHDLSPTEDGIAKAVQEEWSNLSRMSPKKTKILTIALMGHPRLFMEVHDEVMAVVA